jgi:basic membrane protein A
LSFGYGDQILEVAGNYPDVKFEHALGFQQAENVSTFSGARHEAYYLAGIVAAEQTPSGTLGFIGPFPIPIIVWDLNAFTLGARSVNPEATTQVVWTNAFQDPVLDRQAAGALVDTGVGLLAQASGSPSVGEVATTEGLPWMGHSDARVETFGPETFLAAPYLDWGLYFVSRANAVVDGSWESQNYFGTIADDFVDIALSEQNVPDDVAGEVDAKKQEIADGSFIVFEGPISAQDGSEVVPDGETASLDDMSAILVEGVIGEIPAG